MNLQTTGLASQDIPAVTLSKPRAAAVQTGKVYICSQPVTSDNHIPCNWVMCFKAMELQCKQPLINITVVFCKKLPNVAVEEQKSCNSD